MKTVVRDDGPRLALKFQRMKFKLNLINSLITNEIHDDDDVIN